MVVTTAHLVGMVRSHRLYTHPIFEHWAQEAPTPDVIAAMFHQIQCFCASTRPGWAFPEGLRSLGLKRQAELMEEIVASESGHGPQLARMAGHIVNRAAGRPCFADVYDQEAVEAGLKKASDAILGALPGYDKKTGLTVQAEQAIAVFDRRKQTDPESVWRSLGTALALEIISNQELIPGEKLALVDSNHYGASLDEPEMEYLKEHWGELGAEQHHEQNVVEAVTSAVSRHNKSLIAQGMQDFLDALTHLWDVIDTSLLRSGYAVAA